MTKCNRAILSSLLSMIVNGSCYMLLILVLGSTIHKVPAVTDILLDPLLILLVIVLFGIRKFIIVMKCDEIVLERKYSTKKICFRWTGICLFIPFLIITYYFFIRNALPSSRRTPKYEAAMKKRIKELKMKESLGEVKKLGETVTYEPYQLQEVGGHGVEPE